MSKLARVFAVAIILAFIASVPMALAQPQSDAVQVVIVLRHSDNFAKPGGGGGSSSSGDYKIWFRGYQTAVPANLVVYTGNDDGLTSSFITSAVTAAVDTWDTATTAGNLKGTITTESGYGSVGKDGQNTITFGNYPQSGVIAVTYAWVDRATKKLIEFDIMFDTDFQWGDANQNLALMDLQNIATHELGHGFNLSDLYTASKSALTMYGYSTEGETQKRTLESGDITGIQAVFGP